MLRLYVEAPVQGYSVHVAAENDGFVSREKVYEFGGYGEERMLRGFTRPVNRIAKQIRRGHGIATDGVEDIFKAAYEPGNVLCDRLPNCYNGADPADQRISQAQTGLNFRTCG
jgi:hypothetical protein